MSKRLAQPGFLSTLSLRRATKAGGERINRNITFLSTLSLRRATLLSIQNTRNFAISIHALLAESDQILDDISGATKHFYPRSPCGERRAARIAPTASRNFYPRSPCGERPMQIVIIVVHALFLSTLSLRRATVLRKVPILGIKYFYPRSPCGERRPPAPQKREFYKISIHALLAESDRLWTILYSCPGNFYPRSPCGERRPLIFNVQPRKKISIHALLAESDARRESRQQPAGISIHALLAESDTRQNQNL